jgi:hypothetical protein
MKIYISGAITGMPDLNRPAFQKAAEEIAANGNVFINPHEICAGLEGWNDCMKMCIREICLADQVYMLTGWQKSKGAKIEHSIAKRLGIPIVYQGVE